MKDQNMFCLILRNVRRDRRIAATTSRTSSRMRIMPPVSLATSEPLPMAMPISATASGGAAPPPPPPSAAQKNMPPVFLGDTGAAADGDANIGHGERRRVIHTVAHHGHDFALFLQVLDDLLLVGGTHLRAPVGDA